MTPKSRASRAPTRDAASRSRCGRRRSASRRVCGEIGGILLRLARDEAVEAELGCLTDLAAAAPEMRRRFGRSGRPGTPAAGSRAPRRAVPPAPPRWARQRPVAASRRPPVVAERLHVLEVRASGEHRVVAELVVAVEGRWYATSDRSLRNSVSSRRRSSIPSAAASRPRTAVVHDQHLRPGGGGAFEHVQRRRHRRQTRSPARRRAPGARAGGDRGTGRPRASCRGTARSRRARPWRGDATAPTADPTAGCRCHRLDHLDRDVIVDLSYWAPRVAPSRHRCGRDHATRPGPTGPPRSSPAPPASASRRATGRDASGGSGRSSPRSRPPERVREQGSALLFVRHDADAAGGQAAVSVSTSGSLPGTRRLANTDRVGAASCSCGVLAAGRARQHGVPLGLGAACRRLERAPRRQRLQLAGADGVGAGWADLAEALGDRDVPAPDWRTNRHPAASPSAARSAWSMRSMFEAERGHDHAPAGRRDGVQQRRDGAVLGAGATRLVRVRGVALAWPARRRDRAAAEALPRPPARIRLRVVELALPRSSLRRPAAS